MIYIIKGRCNDFDVSCASTEERESPTRDYVLSIVYSQEKFRKISKKLGSSAAAKLDR